KEMLVTFFEKASQRINQPIKDITKQSKFIDDYLGKRDSTERHVVSDALAGIARRLNSAISVKQWKALIEE
ncbi:MAG: nucleotidyltransferase, partial [Candidatus Methanofastidiosa archaeon]|nr:nucleotidyltransferase [Candidatus Methanofastidiosa archaeon]